MSPVETSSHLPMFNRILLYLEERKYTVLLISFLVLIFGNTFTKDKQIFGIINVYQNLLIGLLVFYDKKGLRNTIVCIILAAIALDLFADKISFVNGKSGHGALYLIFFGLVVKEVSLAVLYVKTVSTEMLAAALCGFVLLTQIGTFLFYLIEIYIPHSFSNIGEGGNIPINLNYFSFTTLLTIGFGDISPLSFFAKRAVMFLGLLGHFYTVFITGIIIGKYLTGSKS
jgi:hypothetical protein